MSMYIPSIYIPPDYDKLKIEVIELITQGHKFTEIFENLKIDYSDKISQRLLIYAVRPLLIPIIEKYLNEDMPTYEIAPKIGISPSTLRTWINKHTTFYDDKPKNNPKMPIRTIKNRCKQYISTIKQSNIVNNKLNQLIDESNTPLSINYYFEITKNVVDILVDHIHQNEITILDPMKHILCILNLSDIFTLTLLKKTKRIITIELLEGLFNTVITTLQQR